MWWWRLVGAGVCVALSAAACGTEVTQEETGAGADPECVAACVDKGLSEAECEGFCVPKGTGGDQSTDSSSKSSTATTGGAGGDALDITYEKSCFECWEDNAETACTEEHKACESSLACTQLRNCPFQCVDKGSCVEECNEVIPSGVEPLTALTQCMSCGVGPCATECADSVTQVYCE